MDDYVRRYWDNADVALGAIAAALISPTAAVVATLLGVLYVSGKNHGKIKYDIAGADGSRLKEVVYEAIIKHNDGVKKKLAEYGFKAKDTDELMQRVVYEKYIDDLVPA